MSSKKVKEIFWDTLKQLGILYTWNMIWDKYLGYIPVYLEYLVPQYLVNFEDFITTEVNILGESHNFTL